ncbi:MAG: Fic family protein [Melioribacteraceae bacterium]|nr:Fic family protein [Melioribacteraceae bacterium]MCF8356875.1 Fic family protein [Melioribacteraceae bacterium]MCF8395867.1 Fic family protein [Melioribacteraceae bacterium]MCF8420039.1 Fic family protein [Melioribacteraceae bacterium]
MKNGLGTNQEIEYLEELIRDFPPPDPLPAAEAFLILQNRYQELEKKIELFISTLDKPDIKWQRLQLKNLVVNNDIYPLVFYIYVKFFHSYLFDGILKNAGSFRKIDDPNNGKVGFGGLSPRTVASPKFLGANPNNIGSEVKDAVLLLQKNALDPIRNGLEFYRRFVFIHPFYDANGRIGRIILSIYLLCHNKNIMWRDLEQGGNKTSFLKKINNCHKRSGGYKYGTYFNYLYEFFIKFIFDINTKVL